MDKVCKNGHINPERYPTGQCKPCARKWSREQKDRIKADPTLVKQRRAQVTKYMKDKRTRAIKQYGGKCVCCGETEMLFLQLGHINNDGADHRRELGGQTRAGFYTYHDLEKRGWPENVVQVECANCNFAKRMTGGVCPHGAM